MFSTSESKPSWPALFIVCLISAACLFVATAAIAGQPRAEIPSLNATVNGLRFYESGQGFPPKKERVYRTEFSHSQARFINWELDLKYPRPRQKTDFQIRAKYYRSGGKLLWDQTVNSYISPKWTSSNHSGGYGSKDPGTWKAGKYRVELFVDGAKVASGNFTMGTGKGGTSGKANKKLNKGKTVISDDLGEL